MITHSHSEQKKKMHTIHSSRVVSGTRARIPYLNLKHTSISIQRLFSFSILLLLIICFSYQVQNGYR